MKKLINNLDDLLNESISGFCNAHSDLVVAGSDNKFIRRRQLADKKVALISGGGSGHEPLHAGFVGSGMLDAACPGEVFTSPTPDQMLAAAKDVDTGSGVLFIVKNYEGDVMNFEMAAELYEGDCASVVTDDDVAVEKSTYSTGRRGVAGTMIVEKILGSAAESGMDLNGLQALGEAVNSSTRSMGVALTSCTVPAAGSPTFDLGDDEIEMGVGIHGEPGRKRISLESADTHVNEMVRAILDDLGEQSKGEAIVLVNGFGASPLMELYLVYNCARNLLEQDGVRLARSMVGNYVTSLDMAGCSITVCMADDNMLSLWDQPVHTPALRWGC
jgi:dihydroxyacetone kinase-like protein